MARTLNFKNLNFSPTLLVLLLMAAVSVFGQTNLITNGDFDQGNSGFYSAYGYTSGQVNEGQYCIDVTTNNHGGGIGWEQISGYGGSGKFMMVNGRGSNNTEKVWATGTTSQPQAINVTTETYYRLSFKVANQNRYPGMSTKAKLEVWINNNVIPVNNQNYYTILGDNSWHNWPSDNTSYYRWYSGNNTQALIEIRDIFEGNSGMGDDFCLDNISFVPEVVYSVTTNDDPNNSVCLNQTVAIPVLDNDVIMPSGNNNNVTLSIITPLNQINGTTTMPTISNNIIYYNYNDANYTGNTASFQYQVTWHGLTSTATVQITLNRPPTIGNIELTSPIMVCEGESLTLPTPSVTPSGSTHGWQVKFNGSWQNVNGNTIPSVTNGYTSVRYYAENQCTPPTIYSEEFQIVVNDEPTVGSISNIVPSSVCAPYTFSFSPPSIQNNGSDLIPSECGWQMQINGQWAPVPNPIEYQHNGCSIRYHAENGCGSSNSNVVQLTVNAKPLVGNITAPTAICAGTSFNLTTPSITWRHNDPSTYSEGWEIKIGNEWVPLDNNNISYDYNGCYIRYKAHNGCCDEGEYVYSNQVAVTVYSTDPIDEGVITACDPIYHHGVLCDTSGPYEADSITPNGCTIQVSWQFQLSEAVTEHPQTEVWCGSFTWSQNGMTYYVSDVYYDTVENPNDCDDVYILYLTINNAPVFTEQLASPNPIEVCSSLGALNVSAPLFENGGTPHWEYAVSENGPWISDFDPSAFNLGYGNYWLRYVVANSCGADSTVAVPFYVSEAPIVNIMGGQQLHDMEICDGEVLDLPQVTVEWNNQPAGLRVRRWEKTLEQGGAYVPFDTAAAIHNECWIRYFVQNTCDQQVLGPVHVSVINVQDDWRTHDGCNMVEFGGIQYTADTVIDELVNEPCPHTVHHNIIVYPSEYEQIFPPQSTCYDSVIWHGQTYYRIDGLEQLMHFDTVTEHGCSKVLEQQLVFGDNNSDREPRIGCGSYTWPRNGITYVYDENHPIISDSVIYHYEDACDSVIYLDLTLGRDYEVEGIPMEPQCYGFEWHGVAYYNDAIIYDSLKTAVTNCDSIIRYHLTIIQPFDTIVEMESCKPFLWYCQDQENLFDEDEEEFTATLTSQVTGCDSIVTIRFNLLPQIELPVEDVSVCEPFILPDGQIVNHSGPWSYTIQSLDECDTIVSLNVAFVQTDTIRDEPISACNFYSFHGFSYGPGFHPIYYDTVFTQDGCISSVHLLNLTVNDSEQVGSISGLSSVYVASNLVSGIYRYEVDPTDIIGDITWNISNPYWYIVESQDNYCRILVTTPESAVLTASFLTSTCGEMERQFEINAGFFGVDEHNIEVNLYPNPTKGMITVEAESIESIRLINMFGQTLDWSEHDHAQSVSLNLNHLTPAIYLLEIRTTYGVVKRLVMIQK